MQKYYTCLGCGFQVFQEVFSCYEICPICNSQDDSLVIDNPFVPRYEFDISLYDYQKRSIEKFPKNILEIKKAGILYERNKNWIPIRKETFVLGKPYFPQWKYKEYFEKYGENKVFKKLFERAKKYNPDQ